MKLRHYICDLEHMRDVKVDHFVVAFSGGVDSSFILMWLEKNRPDAHRTAVRVLWDAPDATRPAPLLFGATLMEIDGRRDFFDRHALAAIRHNAFFSNRFPISSSLTRPLIAGALAKVWRRTNGGAIVHSATHMQNTARRLERSLATLAPEAVICAPFVSSNLSREEKLEALRDQGFAEPGCGIYSVDLTPVARVIENGSLEDPANAIPAEGVFEWTRDIGDAPDRAATVEIGFEAGVPARLDGRRLELHEIFAALNELGGVHGIGRFSGLEDTAFGVKNHEIREAPGLAILIEAHQSLENAVLTSEELLRKAEIDRLWTHRVVEGGWFDELTAACDAFSVQMEKLLTGTVALDLLKGRARIRFVRSPNCLSYMAFPDAYSKLVQSRGPELIANVRDLPVFVRSSTRREFAP